MSNTFGSKLGVNEDLIPRMFAEPLPVLREECSLLRTANKDFANAAGNLGDTVTVPITQATTTENVTPAMIPPQAADMQTLTKNVSVTEWIRSKPFSLTMREIQNYQLNGLVPAAVRQSVRALARTINQKIFSFYYRISGAYGIATSTGAFASDAKCLSYLKAALQRQLCWTTPYPDLFLSLKDSADLRVIDNYIKNPQLVGRADMVIGNEMVPFMGFNTMQDRDVPVHTAGTITLGGGTFIVNANTAAATANSATVADASDVVVETTGAATVALKKGDLIAFGSQTSTMQFYTVQADLSVGTTSTGTLTVMPRLQADLTAATAVALVSATTVVHGTGLVNIACQPEAFGMIARVSKPDYNPDGVGGGLTLGTHAYITDDGEGGTGLPLKISCYGGYEMMQWQVSLLYGCDLVDPRLAARLLSYTTA